MSQNENVDMRDYRDDDCNDDGDDGDNASLALARKLQEEYDSLAFASSMGSINDDFRLSNHSSSEWSAMPSSKGKQPMTDEEYARQLADEVDDYHSDHTHMTDEEFARLLQMQEDPNFNFSSPFPPTPKSHSPSDTPKKHPYFVPSSSQQVRLPPSPPFSQPRTEILPAEKFSPYTSPTFVDGGYPFPLLPLSSPPHDWPLTEPNLHGGWRNTNDPALEESIRLAHKLSQNQTTSLLQSTTDNDEILARILQEEGESGDLVVIPGDEEFARKLQEELDSDQPSLLGGLYPASQGSSSAGSTNGPISHLPPLVPPLASKSSIRKSRLPRLQSTGLLNLPQHYPPQELIKFPQTDEHGDTSESVSQHLLPIPMAGTTSPSEVPTDPPPYWEHQSSGNVFENPMTDNDAIMWFREALPKRYQCESCSVTLRPDQLIYQTACSVAHCTCPHCKSSICIACSKTACTNHCGFDSGPEPCRNITHCPRSRQILLYKVLATLDRMYLDERKREKSRAQTRPRQHKPQGHGVGYTREYPNPASQPYYSGNIRPEPSPADQAQQQQRRDVQLCQCFRKIALILKGSAILPGTLNLMRMSFLGQAMEELLRNDSISDCSERAELYAAFLTALEAIALTPALVEYYTSPRDEIECTDGLEAIISGEGQLVKKKDCSSSSMRLHSANEGVTAPPLLELMENLGKQAETFYKTMGNVSLNSADENVVNSINLCKSIIGVRKLLVSKAQRTGPSTSIPASQQVDESETYRLSCADLAYDEFPNSIKVHFHYTATAQALRSVNPRRTITLAKELSTMATSLPPGIFVRSMPNRPDCIKALIAGADGTPYYGGLFEFDIFAPENYPIVPPKVQLKTTANGKVRFNPNLYQDGKVCLSLIGTWHGSPEEQWQANKSTIMQILISIQSMLLCARPYYNEPGMGVASDSPQDKIYNLNVRLQTIRVAMCDWMTASNSQGLWKDVIKMHFTHYAKPLQRNILESAQIDNRIRNYSPSSMSQCGTVNGGFMGPGGLQAAVPTQGFLTPAAMGPPAPGFMVPMAPGAPGVMGVLAPVSPGVKAPGTLGTKPPGALASMLHGTGPLGSPISDIRRPLRPQTGSNVSAEDLVRRFEQGLKLIKSW